MKKTNLLAAAAAAAFMTIAAGSAFAADAAPAAAAPAEAAPAAAAPAAEAANPSLYEQLGGEKAVDAAVDLFYKKVLADDRVKGFFEGVDMKKQAAMQKNFLTFAFGGPSNYTGKDMRAAHAHLVKDKGLNDTHFDAIVENLGAALKELGVKDELIQEVVKVANSVRKDVLNK